MRVQRNNLRACVPTRPRLTLARRPRQLAGWWLAGVGPSRLSARRPPWPCGAHFPSRSLRMAATPPVSLLFASPSPTRGGVEAPFTQRQPSWGPPATTPVTPGSRYLQPLQAPRTDGSAARGRNVPPATEVPPLPVASALFSVRASACVTAVRFTLNN